MMIFAITGKIHLVFIVKEVRVPALVINGEVRASGSLPPKAKLKAWIQQAANQKQS